MKFQYVATLTTWLAVVAVFPAQADTYVNGTFGGTVDDGTYTDSGPVNTTFQVGQPITGSFSFDESSGVFNSFTIGGYTAAPGFTSIYSPALSSTAYAFFGVQNPQQNAGPTNDLQINFYYEIAPFPSTANIASFMANPGNFSTDLSGGSPSYFAAYVTNPNSSVTEVDGLLTSYSATTVPEPESLLLMLPALAGLGLIRRRNG